MGGCVACPWEDLAPPSACMADLISAEKLRQHLNQQNTLLYGVSHLCDSFAAKRL